MTNINDILKGFKTHVEGCILLGKEFGILGKQKAILNSRITLKKFMNFMKNEEFKLKIIGGDTVKGE